MPWEMTQDKLLEFSLCNEKLASELDRLTAMTCKKHRACVLITAIGIKSNQQSG